MELSNTQHHSTNPKKALVLLAAVVISVVIAIVLWNVFNGDQSDVSSPGSQVQQAPAPKVETNEPAPTPDYTGTYALSTADGGNASIVLLSGEKVEGYAYGALVYTGTYKIIGEEIWIDVDGVDHPEEKIPGKIKDGVITDVEDGARYIKK